MPVTAASNTFKPRGTSPGGFQLHRLEPDEGADAALVDIVLVHGLTGDPMATWDVSITESGACSGWPVDLANELRGKAQLWTAGYLAPLLASSNDPGSMHQQGGDALSALAAAGLGERKILFVAHSLGGLLVKALLSAADQSDDEREQQVLQNTHGVVFVGTPHSGSKLTLFRHAVPAVARAVAGGLGWLAATALGTWILAATLVSVKLLGFSWTTTVAGFMAGVLVPLLAATFQRLFRPSEHILNLDPDNPVLYDLTNHYRRILGRRPFNTRAFFEQQKMWLLVKAVPRASADPGVTDCKPVGVRANHVSMCKAPHSEPIAGAVRELIHDARRGVDHPVFERYLNPKHFHETQRGKVENLLRMSDGSYVRRFADFAGDRKEGERILREHLRHRFSHSDPPTEVELDLAAVSSFDLDAFVWCLWHERNMIRSQQKLRLKAEAAMDRWEAEFKLPRPSLISFYRAVRTIEHNLLGDLAEKSSQTERVALLDLLRKARATLDARCPAVTGTIAERKWALDGDGNTRRMLLRMQFALEAGDASHAFVERETTLQHEDMARHRSELELWRKRYSTALETFNAALAQANQAR